MSRNTAETAGSLITVMTFLGAVVPPGGKDAATMVRPGRVCQNAGVKNETLSRERKRFETMLVELSSRFVNLDPADVDGEIEDAQRRVCQHLDLELSALWQLLPGKPGLLRMSHLYRPHGGPPIPTDFDAREHFPWGLEQILANKVIRISSLDEVPPAGARDREVWEEFGVKSVVTIPLCGGGGTVIGFLGFHVVGEERQWSDEVVMRLELVSQIFCSALQRKRADANLRESEERLNLAADSAGIGIWSLDIESQLFWTNLQGRKIFGYGVDEEVSLSRFLDSVHPESREIVADVVRCAVEEGQKVDVEYRIVKQGRRDRWVRSTGRVQAESAVRRASLLGATADVTERKESQEKLQRAFAEVQALRSQLETENAYLRQERRLRFGSGHIVGESSAIIEVLEQIEQVAPTDSTVLVEGETGTGKELVAHRIHQLSERNGRPMIKVNCAALPSTLVESELFGREKGAFTGAVSRELGRFEVADGSTIFLDEIAELPFELQSKLLRVLEEGQFERVGSSRTLTTDVRVVAATNRDLAGEVEAGRFRQDLFYRLAVFPIRVPPLRERSGDVPLLVWSFVHELSKGMNKSVETIRQHDMEKLQRYAWPGNVRELRNVVERSLILCTGPNLRVQPPASTSVEIDWSMSLDEVQRRHILKVLELAGGRIRGSGGAAEVLNLKPTTLRSRMIRLGLDPRKLRDEGSFS